MTERSTITVKRWLYLGWLESELIDDISPRLLRSVWIGLKYRGVQKIKHFACKRDYLQNLRNHTFKTFSRHSMFYTYDLGDWIRRKCFITTIYESEWLETVLNKWIRAHKNLSHKQNVLFYGHLCTTPTLYQPSCAIWQTISSSSTKSSIASACQWRN